VPLCPGDQSGTAITVARVYFGTSPEQGSHEFRIPCCCGGHERGVTGGTGSIDIGTGAQHGTENLRRAARSREHQGRTAEAIMNAGFRARRQERLQHVRQTPFRGHHQRRCAAKSALVHVGAGLNQAVDIS